MPKINLSPNSSSINFYSADGALSINFSGHRDEQLDVYVYAIDKTWLEIYNACAEGKDVYGYDIPATGYEIPEGETSVTITKFELCFMQHNIINDVDVYVVNFKSGDVSGDLYTFSCNDVNEIPTYVVDIGD